MEQRPFRYVTYDNNFCIPRGHWERFLIKPENIDRFQVSNSDKHGKQWQEFCSKGHMALKLVMPENKKDNPFPTHELQFRQIVKREIGVLVECSLQRSITVSPYNKMIVVARTLQGFEKLVKWLWNHRVFKDFQTFLVEEAIEVPGIKSGFAPYNYLGMYYAFGYPKVSAMHLGQRSNVEHYFLPLEWEKDMYHMSLPGCLIGTEYRQMHMYHYRMEDKVMVADKDEETGLQLQLDTNVSHPVVLGFRKRAASITHDVQKRFTELSWNFFLPGQEPLTYLNLARNQQREILHSCRALTCPIDKYHYMCFQEMLPYSKLEAEAFQNKRKLSEPPRTQQRGSSILQNTNEPLYRVVGNEDEPTLGKRADRD